MSEINVHVGYDRAATKARVLAAIKRAQAGDRAGEAHVTFESWDGLAKVLTEKRLALLRHVHRQPAVSVADLARALRRDYKRVHEDVEILTLAGLIERPATGEVRASYDEIRTAINLRQSAA